MAPNTDATGPHTIDGPASSKPWTGHPLLVKPLYAFDLPAELTSALVLRSTDVTARESEEATPQTLTPNSSDAANRTSDGPRQNDGGACLICPGAPVPKGAAQVRAHLRSDWHRYNAALQRRGHRDEVLSEDSFHKLMDELSSDSDDNDDDNERHSEPARERAPQDPVATLLGRMRKMSINEESDITDEDEKGGTETAPIAGVAREPYLWFTTRNEGAYTIPQTQIGILRFLFPDIESATVPKDWYAGALQQMQPGPLPLYEMRKAARLKGAAAANEAAGLLGAVFVDASGDQDTIDENTDESDDGSAQNKPAMSDAGSVIPSSRSSLTSTSNSARKPIRTWTILLMGGGDFAAIIVALNPYERIVSEKKGTSERQFLIVARKQFHRYTTRRKQGGSQSAQDATGRFAKSAGSQLRRYGEQQLGEEIRELLDSPQWRAAIQGSERVWVRAGLRSARGVLWNWPGRDESPLDEMRQQDKVYSLPIATRKPTVGECLRCFAELTRVRVRHETEEEMEKRDAMYRLQAEGAARARQERQEQRRQRLAEKRQRESAFAAKHQGKKAKVKLDAAEQLRRERLVRLVEMLRKGRLQNAINHLDKYEFELLATDTERAAGEPDDAEDAAEASRKRVNAMLPEWWRSMDARQRGVEVRLQGDIDAQVAFLSNKQQLVPATLLQVAADGGHEDVVNYFLVERRADPTIEIPPPPVDVLDTDEGSSGSKVSPEALSQLRERFPHRAAYDLCSTREARDAFRRLVAAQPDWAAWSSMDKGGARVAKALTGEMEEARNKEEETRNRRTQMRERARQRQLEAEAAQAHTITDQDRQDSVRGSLGTTQTPLAAASQSHATSNRLGGPGAKTAPRALQKQRDEAAGLTPEMRQRIEREKRARAAEARFKAMQPPSE